MHTRRLELQISLKSPLMIGSDGQSTLYNQTRDYIPGSALRGALAGAMTAARAEETLAALFGDQTLAPVFENLYPSRGGGQTYPAPLSARTCKYYGGFRSQEDEHHGVVDILIRQAIFEPLLEARVELPCLYEPRCPECHGAVESLGGYYEGMPGRYKRTTTPVRRISRTAIDRWRQTAADRLLYTIETIEPGKQGDSPILFRGAILCTEAQEATLERWLRRVNSLGGGRSRGLGRVEVEVLSWADDSLPALRERIEEFDKAVRGEWRFYQRLAGVEPPPEGVRFFSVDLVSPAFLTHHSLPATHPALEDLGLPLGAVRLWKGISRQTVMGGWHLGGKLPRRTALATEMGSVFMYRTEGLSLDELEARLQELELAGLGAERSRGFGRVLISSPIHYQAEEQR